MKNDGAWAQTTNLMEDVNLLPVQQASSLGTVNNYVLIAPYGMHYNAPVETLCYALDNEKRIGMATSSITRIPVESGEVIYFHPVTKTRVHMKNSGDVTIENVDGTIFILSEGKVTINSTDIEFNTNKLKVTAEEVEIEADEIKLKADDIELDGDVKITGDLEVEGQTELGAGGAAIARVGDTVVVNGEPGVITTGSANNTAN